MEQKDSKKKKLHKKKMTAMTFLGILVLICLMNLISQDKEFSEKENRMLEQKPEFTLSRLESGRFMEQYESYKSDQFVGRDFWVSLKSHVDLIVGRRESNGVFKGKDHYLLEDIPGRMKNRCSRISKQSKRSRILIMIFPCI